MIAITIPYAIACYLVYSLISNFLTTRRNAAKARRLNCEEPPIQKNRYPLGIDNLLRALAADRAKQYPVDMMNRAEDVGSVTYKHTVLGSANFQTADPKNLQAMLATQFQDFDLGPQRRGNFFPLLGNGIFTQDGKPWQHSRAMIRPQFTRDQVSNLDLEEAHVQNSMKLLDPMIQADGWIESVDLLPYFFRLTIDLATEFLFGESVNSQLKLLPGYESIRAKSSDTHLSTSESESAFAHAFDVGQAALATRARFMDSWWLYDSKQFRDSCKIVHKFIDQFVKIALSKDPHELEKSNDSKEKYIFLEALATVTRDPLELRSQLLNVLIAGRDTTASHMGWIFYCLSRDPARYKKLRDIILQDFGTYTNPSEITFAKLKACQYLQFVNNESLRLFPVVPVNMRYANKDTTLPRGGGKDGNSPIFIPKGATIEYSVHVMHHRKDIWGLDAEEFKPERWEGRKVGWEYLPFNGGPRICLGQQFALTETSYLMVRMLQRFDKIEALNPDEVVKHNLTLVNGPPGVNVRLHTA
ncbi:hypothetical protein EAF04_007792 [Stromatinia cepivora]|nr:hypothetical protein EAF04_007792 [Stromatinia cepivora]